MGQLVSVDAMASAIMEGLEEYVELATSDMKKAVRKSAKTLKDEISANAPRHSGAYAGSWAVKKTGESSQSLELTVHSRSKYQIAHLLENGHATRGGGRVGARVHIYPAEQHGIEQLEKEIERSLSHG